MSRIEATSDAFIEEIEKLAFTPRAGTALAAGLTSLLPGAAIGGGYEAIKGMQEGESGWDLAGRAGKGALVGGAIGSGAGALAGKLSPQGVGQTLSNIGRRQVHSFTGMTPGVKGLKKGTKEYADYAKSIGIGDEGAGSAAYVKEMKDQLGRAQKGSITPDAGAGWWERIRAKALPKDWNEALLKHKVNKAELGEQVQEKLLREGMTSWPGMVGAVAKDPRRLGLLAKDQWYNTGPVGKALTGWGLYETGKGIVGDPQPGVGRGEQVGGGLGMLAAQAVPMAMPMLPAVGGSIALTSLGSTVGKQIDKLRGAPSVVPPYQTPEVGALR